MGNFEASNIRVQDLDHCGIVAGICDEMGLVEQIDKLLGTHPQEIISPGQVVKAMILNGLGFVSAPLYLFEKFFVGKATEHLLGEGIKPEHLNDDRLGRILDKLAESGLTETFVIVALGAARQFGVKLNSLHLDSSSFHVDGEYFQPQEDIVEPGAIHITHGYSRDHRPDLKQFIVDLMCSGDGDIPLYLRVGDGNETDIEQRWLVIESQARLESDLKQLEKRVARKLTSATSALKQLSSQQFACQPDALQAATALSEQLPYHQLDNLQVVEIIEFPKRGRPRKDEVGQKHYQISATLIPQPNAMDVEIQRAGRFILATNVLDEQVLSDEDVLTEYKAQQATERGFRFLKDPLFFTSSIFLNTPQRVAAMAMVMGLCLLVYSLGQRALRQALDNAQQTVKNQVGKSTAKPTLRWMFQCFMSIHLLTVEGAKHITNLTTERLWILQFFGAPCRKYYLLS
jgi:transposase